jgi:hypothetical protein
MEAPSRNHAAELDRLKKASPPPYPFLHGVAEHEEPIDIELNIRGNPEDLGPKIPRQFLTVLGGEPLGQGSGRLQLAETIVRHPLAARVMANRIWAHLFGHGVVRTPSNFGLMGERPGNPISSNISPRASSPCAGRRRR